MVTETPDLPLHLRLDDLSDPRIALFLDGHLRDMRGKGVGTRVRSLPDDGAVA